MEVTDQACREEIIAILLRIGETRGNKGSTARAGFSPLPAYQRPRRVFSPLERFLKGTENASRARIGGEGEKPARAVFPLVSAGFFYP